MYRSTDGGRASPPTASPVPWTELNDALAITQFYFSPSINPKDVTNSFGGTQDSGTQKYSCVLPWNDVVCGDGGWTAVDPVMPSNVYSSCWQGNGLVWKSTSGGIFGSWSQAVSGINVSDRMAFLPPLAIDTSHPANLYFGTYRVYQTTNNAGNWTAISGDLAPDALITIAVAPTNSNTVYAGAAGSPGDSRVFVTTDALAGVGAAWSDRSTGLPQRFLTHVVVDPHTATTAYVAFSGFSGFVDSLGHVFRTTDGGVRTRITLRPTLGCSEPGTAAISGPFSAPVYRTSRSSGLRCTTRPGRSGRQRMAGACGIFTSRLLISLRW